MILQCTVYMYVCPDQDAASGDRLNFDIGKQSEAQYQHNNRVRGPL